VVHGGENISEPRIVDESIIEIIRKNSDLAPLHNPANLAGILACQKEAPTIAQVAVFDTAFHEGMTADHYLYGLPYEYYEKYHIRKYGFHGTSHEYVYKKLLANPAIRDPRTAKVITCHLGN
jgi:acetate kinase